MCDGAQTVQPPLGKASTTAISSLSGQGNAKNRRSNRCSEPSTSMLVCVEISKRSKTNRRLACERRQQQHHEFQRDCQISHQENVSTSLKFSMVPKFVPKFKGSVVLDLSGDGNALTVEDLLNGGALPKLGSGDRSELCTSSRCSSTIPEALVDILLAEMDKKPVEASFNLSRDSMAASSVDVSG